MVRRLSIVATSVVLALAGAANGQLHTPDQDVQIISGSNQAPVVETHVTRLHLHNTARRVYVVTHHIVDRVVTLEDAMNAATIAQRLIPMRLVNTTLYLDPHRDYIRQGEYKINENSLIPQAQRLALSKMANQPSIVWGTGDVDTTLTQMPIDPQFIIESPNARPNRKRTPIPAVPAPAPKMDKPQVASTR